MRQGLIAPVGVMVRQLSWGGGGIKTQEHTLSSTLSPSTRVFLPFLPCFCNKFSLLLLTYSLKATMALDKKARGHIRDAAQKLSLLTNWLSGSVRKKKITKDRPLRFQGLRKVEGFKKARDKDEGKKRERGALP